MKVQNYVNMLLLFQKSFQIKKLRKQAYFLKTKKEKDLQIDLIQE